MFKISQIISKPVFTIYEGVNVGTVKNFLYDKKQNKVKGLFLFNDDGDMSEYFLPYNKIFSLSADNVIIKNLDCISSSLTEIESDKLFINRQAISSVGENLGKIVDIYFEDKFNVVSFELDSGIILPANKLANIGRDVVIFAIDREVNISKMKTKNKITIANLPNIKVSILDLEDRIENKDLPQAIPIISNNFNESNFDNDKEINSQEKVDLIEPVKPRVKAEISFPQKLLYNPYSIIGKKSKETIYGLNGEVIIKQNQIVNDKIYQKAKKHLKLFELTNCIED